MSATPEVSVILPTLDRAHLLRRAIASVLAQTFTDFELIVVDDGSSDDTPQVVAALDHPRVRYLRNEQRRGAAGAENRGIAAARARFIAFIDDDDEWLPEKLALQMRRFHDEPPSTGVVYTGRWLVKDGTRSYGPPASILAREGEIHRELLNRRTFVPLVCAVVRRECFDDVGLFDETLPTSNDYDLWVRISRRYRFVHIPQPLVIVHHTPGSVSTRPDNIVAARQLLLAKHAEAYRRIGRPIAAFFLWQTGSLLALQGDMKAGRPFLARAVARLPWHPGYATALLVSLLGRTLYVKCVVEPVHRFRHRLRSRSVSAPSLDPT